MASVIIGGGGNSAGATPPEGGGGSPGGDTFNIWNDGRTYVLVRNGGAGAVGLTIARAAGIVRPATNWWPPNVMPTYTMSIPAGEGRLLGPFPFVFNDANGYIQIVTDAADVTMTALRVAMGSVART